MTNTPNPGDQAVEAVAVLPCPFCGDPMRLNHGVLGHVEQSADCPISVYAWDAGKLAAWNTRAIPTPPPASNRDHAELIGRWSKVSRYCSAAQGGVDKQLADDTVDALQAITTQHDNTDLIAGEFTREDRYIVFKKSHLSEEQLAKVERLTTEGYLSSSSHDWPMPTVSCVVIEADWPEYELVWAMIQARVAEEQTNADVS